MSRERDTECVRKTEQVHRREREREREELIVRILNCQNF